MNDEIIAAAEREEQKLLAEIDTLPIFKKLKAVQALLAMYREEDNSAGERPRASRAKPDPKRIFYGRSSKRQEIEDVVEQYLVRKHGRASSGELFKAVSDAGIEIGGSIPSKSLASTLSTSKRFNNVQGLGYGLKSWGDAPGPDRKEAPNELSFSASNFTGGVATPPEQN